MKKYQSMYQIHDLHSSYLYAECTKLVHKANSIKANHSLYSKKKRLHTQSTGKLTTNEYKLGEFQNVAAYCVCVEQVDNTTTAFLSSIIWPI